MADTPRMSALKQISNSLPVANKKVATQQQAARDLSLQQAIGKAPATAATPAMAQQTGAAIAQQAGQQQVANVQTGLEQQSAVGQLGQQAVAQQASADIASLKQGSAEQQLSNEQKFAQISEAAKQEMFDKRKQFAEDQLGQKFSNDRQMADYVRLNAKSEQDWLDYQQKTDQLYKRKSQMLDSAFKKVAQQLESTDQILNQLKDQALKKDLSSREKHNAKKLYEQKLKERNALRQGQIDLQKSLAKEQADAANRQAMFQGVGTIAGAGVGFLAGGPAGAAVGASLGGAATSLLSGVK
jgi:hypothetical protein